MDVAPTSLFEMAELCSLSVISVRTFRTTLLVTFLLFNRA